jgi:hypothetical protein
VTLSGEEVTLSGGCSQVVDGVLIDSATAEAAPAFAAAIEAAIASGTPTVRIYFDGTRYYFGAEAEALEAALIWRGL